MPETSAIELPMRMPRPLADEVERVRKSDPEALARLVAYGLTRRMIFDHLVARDGELDGAGELRY